MNDYYACDWCIPLPELIIEKEQFSQGHGGRSMYQLLVVFWSNVRQVMQCIKLETILSFTLLLVVEKHSDISSAVDGSALFLSFNFMLIISDVPNISFISIGVIL